MSEDECCALDPLSYMALNSLFDLAAWLLHFHVNHCSCQNILISCPY